MCSQQYHRYVNKDREITKKFVQHAEKRGIKALFITVDAPQLGRREKVCNIFLYLHQSLMPRLLQDMRQKFEAEDPAEVSGNKQSDKVDRSQGAARAISVGVSSLLVEQSHSTFDVVVH